MQRSIGRALLTTMLLASAACGSTLQGTTTGLTTQPGGSGTTSGGGGGLSVPTGGSGAPGAPGAGGALSVGTTGSSTSHGAGTTGTVAGSAGGGAAGSAGPTATAPGITGKTVSIGVEYCSSCGTADGVIGAAGAAPSYDTRNVFNAVVNYANAHGGFAGRKLQPLYYDYNASTDVGTQDQAACANWTQDNKVFAIFAAQLTDAALRSCAEHEGGISIGTGAEEIGSTFRQNPHYVDIIGLGLDQLATVTVNGLAKASYFTGKLGIVTWDDPSYHYAVDHGYLPDLAAKHVKVWQTAYITVPQQLNAVSDTSAAVSGAVTKFRSMGIDHVIIQDGAAGVFGGAGLTLEWMDQAKSQRYYPRYGENANNAPGWSVLPSDEQDKLLAVDQTDVDSSYDAGWHTNRTREQCYRIEAAAGYPVRSSNLNDEIAAGGACDTVFLLQRVLNHLTTLTSDAFMNAVSGLGTSYPSSEVYGTKLTPNLHAGGGMVRTEEYFASCQCLHYLGAPYFAD